MTTTRVPLSICAGCGMTNTGATSALENAIPSPGDVGVCFYCGHLAAYADDLTLRPLTDAEMREVQADPDLMKVQQARATYQRNRRH